MRIASSQFIPSGIYAVLSLVFTALFWRYPLVLFLLLLTVAFLMWLSHKEYVEILLFIVAGVFGAIAESIVIAQNGWNYTVPTFFGVPIWLPILWGIAAVFIKRLYVILKKVDF